MKIQNLHDRFLNETFGKVDIAKVGLMKHMDLESIKNC